jgi:hypothetical protein
MSWDSSLNKDSHECVNRHIAISKELPDNDPCRFSLTTPKNSTSAYVRALTISPTSKRVIQDTKRVFVAMHKIRKAKGEWSMTSTIAVLDMKEEINVAELELERDSWNPKTMTSTTYPRTNSIRLAKVERSADRTAAAHASASTVSPGAPPTQ